MSKNVEINIANSSGGYEVLYPKTTVNNLVSGILPINQGGTNANTANEGLYNLINSLTVLNNIVGNENNIFLPSLYNNTTSKITLTNLLNSSLKQQKGSYKGTISDFTESTKDLSVTIQLNISNPVLFFISKNNNIGFPELIKKPSGQYGNENEIIFDSAINSSSALFFFNNGYGTYSLTTKCFDNATNLANGAYAVNRAIVSNKQIKIGKVNYDAYGDIKDYEPSFNGISGIYYWMVIGY